MVIPGLFYSATINTGDSQLWKSSKYMSDSVSSNFSKCDLPDLSSNSPLWCFVTTNNAYDHNENLITSSHFINVL